MQTSRLPVYRYTYVDKGVEQWQSGEKGKKRKFEFDNAKGTILLGWSAIKQFYKLLNYSKICETGSRVRVCTWQN